jgi:thiol-disulfide isomerase/thioredoxin
MSMNSDSPDQQGQHDSHGGHDGSPGSERLPEADVRAPSRTVAWLGMAAVAVTLGLLWMIPTLDDHSDEVTFEEAYGMPGEDGGATIGSSARMDFTLKDMNGVDVKLATFKGKVVLLNFWATWCGPCKVEIPDLVALQDQYRDNLVVLGVLVQDDMNDAIPSFASQYRINYPLLDGNNREDVESAYGPFWGIPSSVIIDREGKIAQKHSGIRSREQFEREIVALVSEGEPSE